MEIDPTNKRKKAMTNKEPWDIIDSFPSKERMSTINVNIDNGPPTNIPANAVRTAIQIFVGTMSILL